MEHASTPPGRRSRAGGGRGSPSPPRNTASRPSSELAAGRAVRSSSRFSQSPPRAKGLEPARATPDTTASSQRARMELAYTHVSANVRPPREQLGGAEPRAQQKMKKTGVRDITTAVRSHRRSLGYFASLTYSPRLLSSTFPRPRRLQPLARAPAAYRVPSARPALPEGGGDWSDARARTESATIGQLLAELDGKCGISAGTLPSLPHSQPLSRLRPAASSSAPATRRLVPREKQSPPSQDAAPRRPRPPHAALVAPGRRPGRLPKIKPPTANAAPNADVAADVSGGSAIAAADVAERPADAARSAKVEPTGTADEGTTADVAAVGAADLAARAEVAATGSVQNETGASVAADVADGRASGADVAAAPTAVRADVECGQGGTPVAQPSGSGAKARAASMKAVSLGFLRTFATAVVGAWAPGEEMTTTAVVERIIRGATAERACAFADLEAITLPDGTTHVLEHGFGKPDYFVSYAWSRPFSQTMDLVFAHLQSAPSSTRVWLDIFAVNQHAAELDAFKDAIDLSDATLLCVDTAGTPFSRIWCLHELDRTLTGGQDRLCMLHNGLSPSELAELFAGIDASKAECFDPADKVRIHKEIEQNHISLENFTQGLKLRFLLDPISHAGELEALNARSGGPEAFDFSPIAEWVAEDAPLGAHAGAACILAGAGTGKSSISAALCASSAPEVSAAFFVRHDDAQRKDSVAMLRTIAYQLALKLPKLREYYCGLPANVLIKLRGSPPLEAADETARILFSAPFAKYPELQEKKVVIVVDALDEADPMPKSQVELDGKMVARVVVQGNRILACCKSVLSKLPGNVRVIVTTRPEALDGRLVSVLRSGFGSLLELRPQELRRAQGAGASGTAADAGVLVYNVVAPLVDPPLPPLEAPPSLDDLDRAYSALLGDDSKIDASQRELLCCIVAAREPLTMAMVSGMGLADAFASLPGHGVLFFERAHRLVTLHKSLVDFLTDPSRSGGGAVDVDAGHERLGRFLTPFALTSTMHAAYVEAHLAAHLSRVRSCADLLDEVLSDFGFITRVLHAGAREALLLALVRCAYPCERADDVRRWFRSSPQSMGSSRESVLQSAVLECPWSTQTYKAAFEELCGTRWEQERILALVNREAWGAQESTLRGHEGAAHAVTFSPDGTRFVTVGKDRTVRVWRAKTGELEALFKAHRAEVCAVAWSHDGLHIASGGNDKKVYVWRTDTGEQVARHEHRGPVNGVVWSADDARIVTCGDYGEVCVWRALESDGIIKYINAHISPAYSVALSHDGARIVSGGQDGTAKIWNATTGMLETELKVGPEEDAAPEQDPPAELATADPSSIFSMFESTQRAGEALADTSDPLAAAARSSEDAAALSQDTAEPSKDAAAPTEEAAEPSKHAAAPAKETAESSDDAAAPPERSAEPPEDAAAPAEDTAELSLDAAAPSKDAAEPSVDAAVLSQDAAESSVEDLRNADLANTFAPDCLVPRGKTAAHEGAIFGLLWSKDDSRIISAGADHAVRVWRADTGRLERALEGHENVVYGLALSPDGSEIASGGADESLRIWDTATGELKTTLKLANGVMSLAWSGDRKRIAIAGSNSEVLVLRSDHGNFGSETAKGHTEPLNCAAWSPDGTRLASAGADGIVCVWNQESGELVSEMLHIRSGIIYDLAWSQDGSKIASGGDDKLVKVWDPETGALLQTLAGHHGTVFGVAWHPDGARMATASEDKYVNLWFPEEGRQAGFIAREGGRTTHDNTVNAVAYSRDGARVASSGSDGRVRIWDAETHEEQLVLKNEGTGIVDIAWSPDGLRIASASGSGEIHIWDATDGALQHTLRDHNGVVFRVAWSGEGTRLVSAGQDGIVRVWEPDTGELKEKLYGHKGHVFGLSITADGTRIASSGIDMTVRIWRDVASLTEIEGRNERTHEQYEDHE